MKNKILLTIVIFLIPIAVISFKKSETNFLNDKDSLNQKEVENQKTSQEIYVTLNKDNTQKKIALEEYLIGVVAAEMPASFHLEALKAQAIAARTFAYQKVINNRVMSGTTNDQAYITVDQMHQKWQQDFSKYYAKIQNAVQSTTDIIITYNNQPINAYYFAMSNGVTENSLTVFQEEQPYLQSVPSPWEQNNRNYQQVITYSAQEICQLLKQNCQTITSYKPVYSPNNRLESITINNIEYSGIEFRHSLKLRSTAIKIAQDGDTYQITTEGYGHGVGMSQYGANGLANEGKNYSDILKYYYKGVDLKKINV